jgi:hypothetical protein
LWTLNKTLHPSETMSGNGAGDGGKTGWSVAPVKSIESYHYGGVPECFAGNTADADHLFGDVGANKFAGVVLHLLMHVHGMMGFPMRLLDDMVLLRDPGEGDGGKTTW